jgi:16S rRNA (guanine527-N7)-methyltransferase
MNDSGPNSIAPKLWFRTICRKNGLEPTDEQLLQLEDYVRLLLDWNARVNLISRKDEANVWQSHILHSAGILLRAEIPVGSRILDLGTGGGLPGIPLKVLRPDLKIVLLDATKKKIDAVQEMIARMGLRSISTVWGRAEEVGTLPAYARSFDLVVARAVAALDDLVKWSKPFLREPRTGGRLITLKGGDLEGEIRHARNVSGVKNVTVHELAFAEAGDFLASDKKIVVVDF